MRVEVWGGEREIQIVTGFFGIDFKSHPSSSGGQWQLMNIP